MRAELTLIHGNPKLTFPWIPVLFPLGRYSETIWEDVPLALQSHGSIIKEGGTEKVLRGATSSTLQKKMKGCEKSLGKKGRS